MDRDEPQKPVRYEQMGLAWMGIGTDHLASHACVHRVPEPISSLLAPKRPSSQLSDSLDATGSRLRQVTYIRAAAALAPVWGHAEHMVTTFLV